MGKIKTRLIGIEEVEKQQKKEQKEKAAQKKATKKRIEKPVEVEQARPVSPKPPKSPKSPKPLKSPKAKPRGKRYQQAKKLVDKTKTYSFEEAVKLLKKMDRASFDQSVELHLVVNEIGLKGEVELPNPTGKIIKITVVDDKVLTNIEKGKIDFDILVTHPSFMPRLAKFAKILGPKGLMPNPKAGTISPNPEELVKKFQKGVLRWKTEAKFPLIHQMIGKISFEEKKLVANAEKFFSSVGNKRILKAYLKSTMSPSVKISL